MKQLAHQLGLAHGTLKYWDLHKAAPTGNNRTKAVNYLGFDPEQRGSCPT